MKNCDENLKLDVSFAMPWGCLQFVIVVFPDHTHLLFLLQIKLSLCGRKIFVRKEAFK